jgi:hypothetical protein
MMVAEVVYFVCMLTSLCCAGLLFRSYRAQRSRLLLWSTLCFAGLAITNALVVVDLMLLPDIDLRVLRSAVSFASIFVLLGGLVWEMR